MTRIDPMRAVVRGAVLLGIVAIVTGAAPAGGGVKPGYWETTSRVLSPIHSVDTERRCVTKEQVRKFMSCYINHHYDCACAEDTVGDGRVAFKGECVDRKNGSKVAVSGSGTYTDTTLSMSADAMFKFMGLPVAGKATIDAKRLSDTCPASGG